MEDLRRILAGRLEGKAVVDVGGDRPQLFPALDRFLASIGKIEKVLPCARGAEAVDRAQ